MKRLNTVEIEQLIDARFRLFHDTVLAELRSIGFSDISPQYEQLMKSAFSIGFRDGLDLKWATDTRSVEGNKEG